MKKALLFVFCFIASCVLGFSQSTHWKASKPGPDGFMLLGYITLDGEEMFSESLEIGTFNQNGICVGADWLPGENPWEEDGHYLYMVTFYGTVGDEVTFKLYDHATEQELELNCTISASLSENYGCIGCMYPEEDPFIFSFTTPVTTTSIDLTVAGHNGEAGHYVLLAHPFTEEGGLDPANVHQVVEGNVVDDKTMLSGDYDLYYFDQTHDKEWINYRQQAFNLQLKKGYLYANQETVTLRFEGTPFTGDGIVDLDYYTDQTNPNPGVPVQFPGVNLIGNPFPENANLDRSYFYMHDDGDKFVPATTESPIAPLEGVFVVAAQEGEQATFTPAAAGNKISKVRIDVLMNRGELVDRAIVSFNANTTLPKFMLNPEDSKLYIAQNDREYAIVESNRENSLPVNFKAESNGTYTLAVNSSEVEMEYLHLIDNLTGADVDLLANPNYQFNATTSDSESRFVLAFKAMTGVEEQNQGNFCFVNGRNLYFCEETQGAEFNLVDMTGRTVSTQVLNGNCVSLDNFATGVYVVRLGNGDNAKTQKIMVK